MHHTFASKHHSIELLLSIFSVDILISIKIHIKSQEGHNQRRDQGLSKVNYPLFKRKLISKLNYKTLTHVFQKKN